MSRTRLATREYDTFPFGADPACVLGFVGPGVLLAVSLCLSVVADVSPQDSPSRGTTIFLDEERLA